MELMKYLPTFYENSAEVRQIQESLQGEDEILKTNTQDLLDQLFVATATWGLDKWEIYLGITVDPNEILENRRSRILTRLRGQGTTTKEMIKNVCRSFTGGEVEIVENSNDYSFIIKFVDSKGVPGNIDYLAKSIEEIKPAHLSFSFEYTYNVWNDLKTKTWDELSTFTWEEVKVI